MFPTVLSLRLSEESQPEIKSISLLHVLRILQLSLSIIVYFLIGHCLSLTPPFPCPTHNIAPFIGTTIFQSFYETSALMHVTHNGLPRFYEVLFSATHRLTGVTDMQVAARLARDSALYPHVTSGFFYVRSRILDSICFMWVSLALIFRANHPTALPLCGSSKGNPSFTPAITCASKRHRRRRQELHLSNDLFFCNAILRSSFSMSVL